MKVMVTGEIGAGKTTLVNQCRQRWNGPVVGWRSYFAEGRRGEGSRVVLCDISHPEKEYTIARFEEGRAKYYPEVFDGPVADILRGITKDTEGLVFMDEIGYIESNSEVFRREVERVLSLPLPALVVLRKDESPLLNDLYSWPGAELLELTTENREFILNRCLRLLGINGERQTG